MKRIIYTCVILIVFSSCDKPEKLSTKTFPPVSLINKVDFVEPDKDWDNIACAFLLKYHEDTFAVTAKHILNVIKTDSMKYLTIDGFIKDWSFRQLSKDDECVVAEKLLNQDLSEILSSKTVFQNDWLVFSIKSNKSIVKPLEFRETPLKKGEKLYVVGWTRKMKEGDQRIYEFEYYKTKGNHILLKEICVPKLFGGLSGSPVLDENGLLVGIVSNKTFEITALKRMFSPCKVDNLRCFLDSIKEKNDSIF